MDLEPKSIEKKDEVKPVYNVKNKKKGYGLFMKNIITRKLSIPFTSVGSNIKENLERLVKNEIEGKCVREGYIKSNSVRIINYSSGNLVSNQVVFYTNIECLICNPVENMKIKVKAVNVTKAGIRATALIPISPIDVFIARDHNFKNKLFMDIKENDEFVIKVIGQRFEINDPVISILGKIIKSRHKKPKAIIYKIK